MYLSTITNSITKHILKEFYSKFSPPLPKPNKEKFQNIYNQVASFAKEIGLRRILLEGDAL